MTASDTPPTFTVPSTGYRVEITTEEASDAARHRRWRETILFGASLLMFAAAFAVSLWTGFLTTAADAGTRQAAIGITLIGALAGFLGGRAAK